MTRGFTRRLGPEGIAALAMLGGGFALRIWLGQGLPLWLDESWTGMIATQPNWASFWREAWLDCNPPLYYAFMALWTGLFGASDIALRAPSLIFALLAALVPLIAPAPYLRRQTRWALALLIALWLPGFEISLDARGYALLLLLSVVQLFAFIRLMASPTRRSALIWASFASLAALTHYHALLVSGVQGLSLLYVHRARALALWPAALAFVPAFGWLAVHAPRLADYARPDVAWYEPMTAKLAMQFATYPLGMANSLILAVIAVILLISLTSKQAPVTAQPAAPQMARALFWAVLASVVALAIALILGTLRPMLTARYLVPIVPGILFGLVLVGARGRWPGPGLAALVLCFALAVNPLALRAQLVDKTRYGFAPASAFVAASSARHLVFTWDHPAARILDAQSLAKLGGFFLQREGYRLPVTAVRLPPGRDGNALLQRLTPRDAGVIWVYNRARASAARHRPPVPLLWHGRNCRLTHGAWIGTLACGPQQD